MYIVHVHTYDWGKVPACEEKGVQVFLAFLKRDWARPPFLLKFETTILSYDKWAIHHVGNWEQRRVGGVSEGKLKLH